MKIPRAQGDPHVRFTTDPVGESLTQQNFGDECDIKCIMERYKRTGILPDPPTLPAMYADLALIGDYQSHMNKIVAADESFNALPAELRAEFDNDPHKFVEFASVPENADKLVKWGLATAAIPSEKGKTDTVTPPKVDSKAKPKESAVKAD